MVWAFLIAAVLVSPFAFVTFRRILVDRRHRGGPAIDPQPDEAGPATPEPPGRDLAPVVAELRAAALSHAAGERFDVELPEDVTIGGRPAEPVLVARLVVDDLR